MQTAKLCPHATHTGWRSSLQAKSPTNNRPPTNTGQAANHGETMLDIRWTMIVIGTIASLVALGIPLIFGAFSAAIAPSRGRRRDTGFAWGTWLAFFYLAYLAFQPKAQAPQQP